ncbi:hypothetical protein SAMN05216288_4286 [Pseudomonas punonensis]|uniref:Uncharacterized protein n=1 Tax=Phytopseudomonas punonensis TaxID=1220495 RepID=A0A1M7LK11_9GAMM|nr:hypothetical protein SAMN05216288_4286 [Pseudomonas punonensis]
MGWTEDYIDLCHCCVSDPATLANMRDIVIPSLQDLAERYRAAASECPSVFLDWQYLDSKANRLELAIASGRLRCQRQPVQQQLFSA